MKVCRTIGGAWVIFHCLTTGCYLFLIFIVINHLSCGGWRVMILGGNSVFTHLLYTLYSLNIWTSVILYLDLTQSIVIYYNVFTVPYYYNLV